MARRDLALATDMRERGRWIAAYFALIGHPAAELLVRLFGLEPNAKVGRPVKPT